MSHYRVTTWSFWLLWSHECTPNSEAPYEYNKLNLLDLVIQDGKIELKIKYEDKIVDTEADAHLGASEYTNMTNLTKSGCMLKGWKIYA